MRVLLNSITIPRLCICIYILTSNSGSQFNDIITRPPKDRRTHYRWHPLIQTATGMLRMMTIRHTINATPGERLIQTASNVVSSGRAAKRILVSHAPSSGLVSNSRSTNDPSATAVPTVSPCDDNNVGGAAVSGSGRPSTLSDCRLAVTLYSTPMYHKLLQAYSMAELS